MTDVNIIDKNPDEINGLLREAFESAADPMFITVQQKILLINNALEKLLGWKRQEVLGTDFTNYTLDSKPMENYLKGLARKNTEDFYPATLRGKHGPIDVKICSTKVYINGKYGRLVILK
jgi:PAS domain S-box-containing protein